MENMQWIKNLNLNNLELYPLQFANCERLNYNDIVFIFDEVGCGKTVSSGLMALNYLYNNPDKNVLVISTTTLIKLVSGEPCGQFVMEWKDMLPFEEMGLWNRICFTNNYYSNIQKFDKEFGLIIVDEAHLFLNKDTSRYQMLSKLKAEKLVFLTATPIKNETSDLSVYCEIGKAITGTSRDYYPELLNKLQITSKDSSALICSDFDVTSPVTRYFKDTVMALKNKESLTNQARRLAPREIVYSGGKDKKFEAVFSEMDKLIKEGKGKEKPNRFVIFVRFVEKEAEYLKKMLEGKGYNSFNPQSDNSIPTYAVVTGDTKYLLGEYSGKTTLLPDVLILTYQIAEQGINLPGYNYVVNWHIPAFPANLEQRFGRIDRMGKNGSIYDEINMWFVHSKSYFDSNTWNFYHALSVYRNELISYIPAKNVIFTEDILNSFIDSQKEINEIIETLKPYASQKEEQKLNKLIDALLSGNDEEDLIVDLVRSNSWVPDELGKEIKQLSDGERSQLADELRDHFSEYIGSLKKIKSSNQNQNELTSKLIKEIGNKIFCIPKGSGEQKPITIDAIGSKEKNDGCAAIINQNPVYINYRKTFQTSIRNKLLETTEAYSKLEEEYERLFFNNQLENIFSPFSFITDKYYESCVRKLFDKEEDIKYILDNKQNLPFFKMCSIFEKELHEVRKESRIRGYYECFDFNPFAKALYRTLKICCNGNIGLSENFMKGYVYPIFNDADKRGFNVLNVLLEFYKDKEGYICASPWYKLAYWFTRKENFVFITSKGDIWSTPKEEDNPFYRRERIKNILTNYMETYVNVSGSDIFRLCYEHKIPASDLQKYNGPHESLFHFFIYTEEGNQRKYTKQNDRQMMNHWYSTNVRQKDYLTAGILSEICRDNYKIGLLYPDLRFPTKELLTAAFGEYAVDIANEDMF